MPKLLFVLGAPNDRFGALSAIAAERLAAAASLYHAGPDMRVIVTGGHGPHFNTAPSPHRVYGNAELVRLGVPRKALEPDGFLTTNTVEDLVEIAAFVAAKRPEACLVLTSAFHVARCKLISQCVAPGGFTFFAAADPPDLDAAMAAHEVAAQASIRARGGVIHGSRFFPLPCAPVLTPSSPA